jgi:hypothetical protein
MNCTKIFKNLLLAFLILGMGLILNPDDTAAFSLKRSEIDRIVHSETDFKINALVMEVNLKKAYIIVGEITIYFMDFKTGGKQYRTAFVNERGDTSYAASVRASKWEEKRVIVKGYKLGSGDIVAESIEKMAAVKSKTGK